MSREDFKARIEAIESGYEFLLAFAAQGVRDDRESPVGGQLRQSLRGMATALSGLGETLESLVASERLTPAEGWSAYAAVVRRDADATLAAVNLVESREAIGSQLVDNLNASIHVRALLTDLFLVDDLLG